jgi:catalase-peroxidase
MRALGANAGGSTHGVFTDRPGTLSNDFFVNLLGMETKWRKAPETEGLYEGLDRATGESKWTATPVDLVFGSHAELRAVAEVYAENGGEEMLVAATVARLRAAVSNRKPETAAHKRRRFYPGRHTRTGGVRH